MPMNEHGDLAPVVVQVDDNHDDIELSRLVIEEIAGGRVHYVGLTDGESAITFLRESLQPPRQPIALLILDINMPSANGWDVLALVEQQALAARIPIVMLSGSRRKSDLDRAERFGIPYYVKPSTFAELAQLLQDLLIGKGLISRTRGPTDPSRS